MTWAEPLPLLATQFPHLFQDRLTRSSLRGLPAQILGMFPGHDRYEQVYPAAAPESDFHGAMEWPPVGEELTAPQMKPGQVGGQEPSRETPCPTWVALVSYAMEGTGRVRRGGRALLAPIAVKARGLGRLTPFGSRKMSNPDSATSYAGT